MQQYSEMSPGSQQKQESMFLEELTSKLMQMGDNKGGVTQQDCIRKLKSLNLDDHFWMFIFKVAPCTRAYAHKWTLCPCAHAGETARRRDPRMSSYKAVLCPLVKAKKACPFGDACNYSHNVFEHWLHPSRYKTRLCSFGSSCNRSICFFAHTTEELRCVPNIDDGKEVDECKFLMQLMVAQESGLLPANAMQPQEQPQQQQQQQGMQQRQPQLPVLYTMAPDTLQQPMQVMTQPMSSSSNIGSARRSVTRSLTGIPLSYRHNMPHLSNLQPHMNAASPHYEVPARTFSHSMSGGAHSAPHHTVQPPPQDNSTYLSMSSLQETLAGLGLGSNSSSGHEPHPEGGHGAVGSGVSANGCDDLYMDNAAAILHGINPDQQQQEYYPMAQAGGVPGQRISDPGMNALLGGGGSSEEEGHESICRISDTGRPLRGIPAPKELAESLGNLLPLMNYAQQQQQHAAVAQAADIAASIPLVRGPSTSPPCSSIHSSGDSACSSSSPNSNETNAGAHGMQPSATAHGSPLAPGSKPASVMQVVHHNPQHQQHKQQHLGHGTVLKQEELRALAASAGQHGDVSASYASKIVAYLQDQGLAGTKEQLVASLSQLLAQLLSVP